MPIFAEYRPLYKISQILFVLNVCSRGGKSSLIRLQLFNWALKDKDRNNVLINASKNGGLNISVWGMDPSLNSAIQFGLAEGLLEKYTNGVSISEGGKKYIVELTKDNEFKKLYSVLTDVGKGVTESMITQVSNSWG